MTPTIKGQYRNVRYTDDGCHLYQCLWCANSIEIRDDPQYGWNFCPICGKSWFKQMDCREQGYPRWAWDKWGQDYPSGVNLWNFKEYELEIVIEERNKWFDDGWGEWRFESKYRVPYGKLGIWRDMQYFLARARGRVAPDPNDPGPCIQFEYRATLRKVKQ